MTAHAKSPLAMACVAAFAALAPAAQASGLGQALDLCTDATLTIPARTTAFETAGWRRDASPDTADAALAHALILSRIDAGNPELWGDEQAASRDIAQRLRGRRGYEGAHVLVRADGAETITLEPNNSGLDTCLYTGPGDDLSPIADLIAPSRVLVAGPRRSIRGDFSSGTVVAHALDPDRATDFPDPLNFTATFTVVLDRREGVTP